MKCGQCKTHPRYKHAVTIEEPSGTPDASGHIDLSDAANWKPYARIKVNFKTRGGREARVFDQVEAHVNLIAQTRSTGVTRGIHPVMRMRHAGEIHNISAAYDMDENREIVQLELIKVE
jgi:head-tail adaptor